MFPARLISFILVLGVREAHSACETVLSAFTIGDISYINTDRRVLLLQDGFGIRGEVDIPIRVAGLRAATALPKKNQYALLSCDGSTIYSEDGIKQDFVAHDFSSLDAATAIGDEVLLFSGSKYQTFNYVTSGAISEAKDIEDLNLPSNLNAAWYDPDMKRTLVVKDDELYIQYDHELYFDGPLVFSSYFSLDDLDLCYSYYEY